MSYMELAIKEKHHLVIREAIVLLEQVQAMMASIGGHQFVINDIDDCLIHAMNDSADEIEQMWEAYGVNE